MWTSLAGGAGGSNTTRKGSEEKSQPSSLADALQQAMSQYMNGKQPAPKRQKGRNDIGSRHQDALLISQLEQILAECKAKQRDDYFAATAIQNALTSHKKQAQTFYPKQGNPQAATVEPSQWQSACHWANDENTWSSGNDWWRWQHDTTAAEGKWKDTCTMKIGTKNPAKAEQFRCHPSWNSGTQSGLSTPCWSTCKP